MSYTDTHTQQEATAWFAARREEQEKAHFGSNLRAWVPKLLDRLPRGSVALASFSVEGCALAAAAATMRSDPTTWRQLSVGRLRDCTEDIVIVEPVRLAPGLVRSIRRALPYALILEGFAADETPLASAA